MKKNIIIALLAILSLVFIIFSFVKADEAEKQRILIERLHTDVKTEKERADMFMKLSEMRAAESIRAEAEAEAAMAKYLECRDGK